MIETCSSISLELLKSITTRIFHSEISHVQLTYRIQKRLKSAVNIQGTITFQYSLRIIILSALNVPDVLGVSQEGRFGDIPLVCSKQQDISTGAVHLVRLTRMNGFFLHCLYLKGIQFLIKHLQIEKIINEMGSDEMRCNKTLTECLFGSFWAWISTIMEKAP